MPSRKGATLVEVLVAIFVMGIGLMALLVLFPLGALSMAQAIQDDRAAQTAVSAGNMAVTGSVIFIGGVPTQINIRNDPAFTTSFTAGLSNLDGRSNALYVDPLGFQAASPALGFNKIAGLDKPSATVPVVPVPVCARMVPSFVLTSPNPKQTTFRFFTLLDDIVFDNVNVAGMGTPKYLLPVPPAVFERDTRFSWGYMLQRPRAADPSVVDLSVVVYSSRSLSLGGNLQLPETAYVNFNPAATPKSEVEFDPTTNVIGITYDNPPHWTDLPPPVRPGGWVLDLSTVRGQQHAFFYRVASVEDTGSQIQIEVQQPLRGFGNVAFPQAADTPPNNWARLVILEGVIEVFERGLGPTP